MLSLIIPCKNEEQNLSLTLNKIIDYLTRQSYTYEIIIVNDGSSDQTENIARKFSQKYSFIKLFSHRENLGKGAAVKTGVNNSQGDLILFLDADLSTPIGELDNFLSCISSYDIIIGSRAIDRKKIIKKQPWNRDAIGRFGNFLIKIIIGLPYKDTQCGFKLFKREAGINLFNRMKNFGWSFDFEILYLAQGKYQVLELPVVWENSTSSRFRFIDAVRCFFDLIVIRFRN